MKSLPLPETGWVLVESESAHLADVGLIEKVARWRNSNLRWFLSAKEVSNESTRNYLQEVMDSNHKVLFWLRDPSGNFVGHFGLNFPDAATAELDNFMIGERIKYPRAALEAEIALLNYCIGQTSVTHVRATVHSANFFAIKNHRFLGFEIVERFLDACNRPFVVMSLTLNRIAT